MTRRTFDLDPREFWACLSVAAVAATLSVPGTLARWWLTQDAIEYLAIANAWVNGAGFVDPVQWTYLASGALPYPSLAMRAPVVSVLAAIPLGLGASLSTVMTLHAVWSSAIAACVLPVAKRCGMGLPAALASALLVATAPAWIHLSRFVWTEATALLAFLLVLATARGAVTSVRGGLLCGVSTLLAWLCRPNLIVLGAVVAVAGAWELGWRRALRSQPLWIYTATWVVGLIGFRWVITVWTGEAPYSRYQALFQVLTTADAWHYDRAYPGIAPFVANHLPELLARASATVSDFSDAIFFDPSYHRLGWLALPGFAWALISSEEHAIERRAAALSGLGLAAIAVLYLDFDRKRFPLFTVAPAILCGVAWLEHMALRAGRSRWASTAGRQKALAWVPLVLVMIPVSISLPGSIGVSARQWRAWRANGTAELIGPILDRRHRPLCDRMHPDAIVASEQPWATHFWCGNAAIVLPLDIDRPGVLERFLERKRPGYLVASAGVVRRFDRPTSLRRLTNSRGLVLLEVVDAPAASRPWRAPPPLPSAGRPHACRERHEH